MKTSQYNPGVYYIWKMSGETLAVLVVRFRTEENIADDIKITYAGRLDSMAEGIVILLAGDARFHKETYNSREKTYELTILLGIHTDTADMLGMVQNVNIQSVTPKRIETVVESISSITELPYPMYSSRPVKGKPLFVHARAGTTIEVPIKKVSLRDVVLIEIQETSFGTIIDESLEIIKKVEGDFRQGEIIQKWKEIKKENGDQSVQTITIKTTVSSGTYMRSLAEWVGQELGVPALAYTITRVGVGESGILGE